MNQNKYPAAAKQQNIEDRFIIDNYSLKKKVPRDDPT